MKTLKQVLEENLIFENPNTKPITNSVISWLTQKRPKTASSEYEHGRWDIITELLEDLEELQK